MGCRIHHFNVDPDENMDPCVIPDAEAFYIGNGSTVPTLSKERSTPGWYWWLCSPHNLPTGQAQGPFISLEEAIRDAGFNDNQSVWWDGELPLFIN